MYPLVILFLQNSYHPVIYFYQISMCLVNSLLEKIICPVIFFDKSNCVVIFFDWEKYPHPINSSPSNRAAHTGRSEVKCPPSPETTMLDPHPPRWSCSKALFFNSVPLHLCSCVAVHIRNTNFRTLYNSDSLIIWPSNYQIPYFNSPL